MVEILTLNQSPQPTLGIVISSADAGRGVVSAGRSWGRCRQISTLCLHDLILLPIRQHRGLLTRMTSKSTLASGTTFTARKLDGL